MIKKINTFQKKILRAKRGLSPIVAEILLIGLTMLAGALTFGTVIVVLTSKEPIVVNIDNFSDFKLEGYSNSTKYNTFSFVIDNQGKRAIGVRAQDFQLFNASSNKEIPNWNMSRNCELSSLQSYYITVTTADTNQSNWISFQSSIKVQIIAYGLEDSYDNADKAVFSSGITVSDELVSVGPLELISNRTVLGNENYATLNSSLSFNNSLEINVQNFGNLNTSYSLDFIVSSRNISMTLHYLGSSTNLSSVLYESLPPAQGDNPSSSQTIVLTASTPVSSTNNYFIIVWLKVNSAIQDTLVISCS